MVTNKPFVAWLSDFSRSCLSHKKSQFATMKKKTRRTGVIIATRGIIHNIPWPSATETLVERKERIITDYYSITAVFRKTEEAQISSREQFSLFLTGPEVSQRRKLQRCRSGLSSKCTQYHKIETSDRGRRLSKSRRVFSCEVLGPAPTADN